MNPADKPQYPHIIPSDEYLICSETPLHITTDIKPAPLPLTKDPTNVPSDENLQKNSVEPPSIHTLNLVHKYDTNIPPVPTFIKTSTMQK